MKNPTKINKFSISIIFSSPPQKNTFIELKKIEFAVRSLHSGFFLYFFTIKHTFE